MLVPISSGVNHAGSCVKTLSICVGAHKFRSERCRELLKDLVSVPISSGVNDAGSCLKTLSICVGAYTFKIGPCRELMFS